MERMSWRTTRDGKEEYLVIKGSGGTDKVLEGLEKWNKDSELANEVSWFLVSVWDDIDRVLREGGAVMRSGKMIALSLAELNLPEDMHMGLKECLLMGKSVAAFERELETVFSDGMSSRKLKMLIIGEDIRQRMGFRESLNGTLTFMFENNRGEFEDVGFSFMSSLKEHVNRRYDEAGLRRLVSAGAVVDQVLVDASFNWGKGRIE